MIFDLFSFFFYPPFPSFLFHSLFFFIRHSCLFISPLSSPLKTWRQHLVYVTVIVVFKYPRECLREPEEKKRRKIQVFIFFRFVVREREREYFREEFFSLSLSLFSSLFTFSHFFSLLFYFSFFIPFTNFLFVYLHICRISLSLSFSFSFFCFFLTYHAFFFLYQWQLVEFMLVAGCHSEHFLFLTLLPDFYTPSPSPLSMDRDR